jgi:hypothetical protein
MNLCADHTEAPPLHEAGLAIALPRILAGAGALPSIEPNNSGRSFE